MPIHAANKQTLACRRRGAPSSRCFVHKDVRIFHSDDDIIYFHMPSVLQKEWRIHRTWLMCCWQAMFVGTAYSQMQVLSLARANFLLPTATDTVKWQQSRAHYHILFHIWMKFLTLEAISFWSRHEWDLIQRRTSAWRRTSWQSTRSLLSFTSTF